MFTSLSKLLSSSTTLVFTVAAIGHEPGGSTGGGDDSTQQQLRVTLTPHTDRTQDKTPDGVIAAINTPLVVTGTPEELDADLVAELERYINQRQEGRVVLTTLEAQIEEARKEADKRLADERKKGQQKPAASASKPAAAAKPAAAPAPKPAPEATSAPLALF